jgi:predicted nucleic acid-binding protein
MAAARYLVDSDICSKALRGRHESLTNVLNTMRQDGLAISVVTYGEVTEGVLFSRNRAVDQQLWRDFLAGFDIIDVTMEIAEVWADVRGSLRKQGNIVPDNDLLIASTALRFGMTVVTGNERHFGRVPGLDVLVPDRP